MKQVFLYGLGMTAIFLAYIHWRFNMIGFHLILYLPMLLFVIGFGSAYMFYYSRPKNEKKVKEYRPIAIMVAALIAGAVLIRLIFLS